ncbi:MAG: hypothetical protein J0I47_10435 [Sphingomonas sp.]|uniref:hypothetical protein n=1 Tax=Sphingomonas sp. TaxID=28214 RepID=UPI001ACF001F|nr:hypothetical protein [Sphingomonas sp.]MBN8808631.1 hypothetical protein [Sphingomonas sp.]
MILRNVVLVVAIAWTAIAAWMVVLDAAAWPMLIFPLVMVGGIVFERFHYTGNASPASPPCDWRPTDERFLDEASGRPVVVWFNAATGERKYVEE